MVRVDNGRQINGIEKSSGIFYGYATWFSDRDVTQSPVTSRDACMNESTDSICERNTPLDLPENPSA